MATKTTKTVAAPAAKTPASNPVKTTKPSPVAAKTATPAPKTAAPAAKTAAAPANKAMDALAKAREARERSARLDRFIFKGELVEGAKKLAPQAQQIVNLIEAAGDEGITRQDLVKDMEGVVETRQPLGRILSYYQKAMIEQGYITVEQNTEPAPKTVKKAAKKAVDPTEAEEQTDESAEPAEPTEAPAEEQTEDQEAESDDV